MDESRLKEKAAVKAIPYVPKEGFVGIGTGSTVKFLIKLLVEESRKYSDVTFVPTSLETMYLLNSGGLRTSTEFHGSIAIDIDGADEIDPNGNLIKGGGAALTREKIVAANSQKLIIIADQSKLVNKLGKFKVPVEILPFLAEQTIQNIENKGCKVTLRPDNKSKSDNGNIVIDSDFGLIDNVQDIQTKLKMIPGVVEVGIFHGMTWKTIVGKNGGVEEINYK